VTATNVVMPLRRFRAAAQDEAPTPSAEPPLVLPLVKDDADVPLDLRVEELPPEVARTGNTSRVVLNLSRRETSTATPPKPDQLLILDRAPFFIARVDVQPLFGDERSEDIAHYTDSETDLPRWTFRGGSDGVSLRLPPQGIGETAEKGIKDAGYFDVGYSKDANGNSNQLAFRFTPTALLTVLPYYKQAFAEPAWNTRRMFGYPGQRAPGAALKEAKLELLYGMGVRIAAPFLRVAEIQARLGTEPVSLERTAPRWLDKPTESQLTAWKAKTSEWNDLRQTMSFRLGVLEPWDDRQETELRLREGISYELRSSARLRHPIPGMKADGLEEPFFPSAAPEWSDKENDSLAGGVAWGFESKAILDAVYREPKSVSGEIAQPFFSALGGWGNQKASFDEGRSTIYANVEMGRVTYYALERIGRIANLFHPAKHVIVYERTVERAAEFNDRDQEAWPGVPLLRKVREYVELLEPSRRYPDDGSPPAHAGCLVATHFKQKQIDVRSSWGHDVYAEDGTVCGWEVPLHRPSEEDAFAKPHILHELAAGPGEAAETITVEHDNPEVLYFYTDVRKGTSADVSTWPTVPHVDYPCRADPKTQTEAGFHADAMEAKLADPPDVAAGFERFTYSLRAGGLLANIGHGRGGRPIGVELRNLTVSRSRPAASRTSPLPTDVMAEEIGRIAGQLPAAGALKAKLKTALESELAAIANQVVQRMKLLPPVPTAASVTTRLDELARRTLDDANARIGVQLTEEAARLKGRLAELAARTSGTLALPELERILLGETAALTEAAKIRARIDGIFRDARAEVEALDNAVKRVEALGASTLSAAIKELQTLALRNRAALEAWLDGLIVRMHALFEQLETELQSGAAPLIASVTAFRTFVQELERAVATRLDQLRAKTVAEVSSDLDTLWAAALDDAKTARDAVKKLVDDVNSAANASAKEFQKRANDLDATLATTLKGEIAKLANVPNQFDTFRDQLDSITKSWKEKIATAATELGNEGAKAALELHGLVGNAEALRTKLASDLEAKLKEPLGKLDNDAVALRRELLSVERTLRAQLASVERAAGALGDAVEATRSLRMVRAFGDVPAAALLDFNRARVAYQFALDRATVATTPMVALVNRAGDQLKSLGVRLPTRELLDAFVPDLSNLDLSKLLPDLAGLKLDDLFPALKAPQGSDIKITHGVDPASRRAWVDAKLFIKPADATLFAFGPALVRLVSPQLEAEMRIETGVDGTTKQISRGRLNGHWELTFGGLKVVTFVDTSLSFDERGHIDFDLNPKRVKFDGVLKFLTDKLAAAGSGKGGFSVRPSMVDGLPMGVEALLDLALPDISGGTFGLANLRLMSSFALRVATGPSGIDFELAASLALARREAPLVLTVGFLSGGGWLDVRTTYAPRARRITAMVSIGLAAGVRLAISIGPIGGAVYAYFGISVEFHADSSRGNHLAIGISLLLGGECSIGGWISVSLQLLLEARYEDGVLTGSGTISIKIKICWCFTFKFTRRYDHTFSGRRSQRQAHLLADVPGALQVPPAIAAIAGIPAIDPVYKQAAVKRFAHFV
jgi:hypothetical protein